MRLTEASIRRIIRESIVRNLGSRRINEADDIGQIMVGVGKSEDFSGLVKMLKSLLSLLVAGNLNDKSLSSAMMGDITPQEIGGKNPVTVAKTILTDMYALATGRPAKQLQNFDNLQKMFKDDREFSRDMRSMIADTVGLAEEISQVIDDAGAGDSGAGTRAETVLDEFTERFPETSKILDFASLRDYIAGLTPAGLEGGFLGDVDAVVGFMGGFGTKPSAELLKRADADLKKVMGGKMTIRPGSTGPAVEVSQRLLSIHLDFIGKQLSGIKSKINTRRGLDSKSANFLADVGALLTPDEVVKAIRAGKPVETSDYSGVCSSVADSLRQLFDGKYGKTTYLGTVLLQAYIKLRQEQGVTEGGVLRLRSTNPAEIDGVIGSQTLSSLLKGDYTAAVSSVAPEKEPEGANLTSGGQGMTDLEEETYQDAMDVFDDVALVDTGESPEQVARYRRGLETNLTREKVMAIAKKQPELNARQIASVLMSGLNFPDSLVGARGLLPAVAQFVNVTKP
jgi:hypothetical protein